MRQLTLSFWLIWIQRLELSYICKNQNSCFSSFCSMGDQIWKKPRKLHHAVSARKYSKSTPAHIRTARRSRRRPPITIEVEWETRVKKLIAHVSAIFLLPVFKKSVILMIFEQLRTLSTHGKVVIRFAGKPWLERGQSTTVWRDVLVPLETPYGETTRARIWRFWSDATKMGSLARPYRPRLSSVANAPGPNFSPFRCLPRGLGHAALDSDHAEC